MTVRPPSTSVTAPSLRSTTTSTRPTNRFTWSAISQPTTPSSPHTAKNTPPFRWLAAFTAPHRSSRWWSTRWSTARSLLWYTPTDLNADDITALTEIVSEHLNDNEYAIQAPYGGLNSPIMLVAWGVRLPLDNVDEQAIEQFFDEFHDDAPEPLAAGGCATAR